MNTWNICVGVSGGWRITWGGTVVLYAPTLPLARRLLAELRSSHAVPTGGDDDR